MDSEKGWDIRNSVEIKIKAEIRREIIWGYTSSGSTSRAGLNLSSLDGCIKQ
jgi:hypothetical protein